MAKKKEKENAVIDVLRAGILAQRDSIILRIVPRHNTKRIDRKSAEIAKFITKNYANDKAGETWLAVQHAADILLLAMTEYQT